MGCISSKILVRSGSLREKARSHGLERSSLVEEIILSGSKSSGDQFLALLRTSSSAARRSKDASASAAAEQNTVAAASVAKIETIDVSELLAGLEEDDEEERQDGQEDGGGKSSPWCASDGAAGRAKSFRTVEEFDALLSRCGSPEQAKPDAVVAAAPERCASMVPLPPPPPPQSNNSSEQEEPRMVAAAASNQDAAVATDHSIASEQGEAGGAKRRARARKLGELRLGSPAAAFHFSKSGSLRDWLLGGGQTFSPGSYVTPRFGAVEPPPPPSELGSRLPGEHEQEQRVVFDPELVAQLELAMEELTEDEERVLREVLEVLEAGEPEKNEPERLERLNDQSSTVAVLVQDVSSA